MNTATMAVMNVDRILRALNRNKVAYMLIGGVNYLLRHQPVLTYDVDVWIEDTEKNLSRCQKALGVSERKPDRIRTLTQAIRREQA